MTESVIVAFLFNALWQIPLIAIVAWLATRSIRRAPARQQHLIWAAALVLSAALPLSSASPRKVTAPPMPSMTRAHSSSVVVAPSAVSLDAILTVTEHRTSSVANPAALLTAFFGVFAGYRVLALFAASRHTRRILRSAKSDISAAVIRRCRTALDINVPVIASREAVTPMTLGAIRPVIILPESLLVDLTDQSLIALVGHELAHIRRRDFAINIALEIAAIPIAFHPITAFLKRRVAETRELACDEEVAPDLVAPRDYAHALVDVAAFVAAAPSPTYLLTMAGGDIEDRIRRIVGRKPMKHSRTLVAAAWAALIITSVAAVSIAAHPRLKLGNTTADARAAAACNAGRARDAGAIPKLLAMLGDDTRIDSIRCYGDGWNPAMESLDHPSPGEQAALALASIAAPAVASLVNALDDPSPVVRRNAAWAIGEVRGSLSVERDAALVPMIRLLTDANPAVRRAAAFGLSELKMKESVGPLMIGIDDNDAAVRVMIVRALGEIADGRARPALAQAVRRDGDAEVRRTAAWALGEIDDRGNP